MNQAVDVVVGTPICRRGANIIDKFLANQKEIQQNYPQSELVLATEENDFIEELEVLISFYELRGRVILFEVIKPDYARSRLWNIACGREALRQYVLFQTAAGYCPWPGRGWFVREYLQTDRVVVSHPRGD